VILPSRNEADLEDVPEELRKGMTFVPVDRVEQVWEAAMGLRIDGKRVELIEAGELIEEAGELLERARRKTGERNVSGGASEKPAVKKPAVKKPAVRKPAARKPAATKPAVRKAARKAPAKPVAKPAAKPAAKPKAPPPKAKGGAKKTTAARGRSGRKK
jgi:cell division septation protein DedD